MQMKLRVFINNQPADTLLFTGRENAWGNYKNNEIIL